MPQLHCFGWFTTLSLVVVFRYSLSTIEAHAFTLLRKQGYVHSFMNRFLSSTLTSARYAPNLCGCQGCSRGPARLADGSSQRE